MDSIHNVYLAWLSRVETNLNLQYDLCVADIGYAEWAFDWHASWVAGCSPHEAIQDALRECVCQKSFACKRKEGR